jgi:hypothetical protein
MFGKTDLNICRSRFDAECKIDDAIPLRTDVQVIEPYAVTGHCKRTLQEAVYGAVPTMILREKIILYFILVAKIFILSIFGNFF